MTNTREAVASTALLVAAVRAEESIRPDRLFTDPFAGKLAGDEGRRLLAVAVAATGEQPTLPIVIRTRYWDEALLRADTTQVVILAAGMDARAYRLPWPPATTVYELDQPAMIATKNALLADEQPSCTRITVGVDLAGDWPKSLEANGFTPSKKTVWLVEGLLQYLDESTVGTLFERIDALSADGSTLCYDVVGAALLRARNLQSTQSFMTQLGAPWTFGTDEPAALVERFGWTAKVTDVAEPGYEWKRWPTPPAPPDDAGAPRGYFVTARKGMAGYGIAT